MVNPRRVPRASGRFLLRVPVGLHAALRAAARDAGLSLNEYCTRKLAMPLGSGAGMVTPSALVERAAATFGERLLGVLAYGSWARREAHDRSDVDVLVVLDGGVAITRALYREWDRAELAWEGRSVEVHFVPLPAPGTPPTGLWAEAAIDGIVLFERALRLSAYLTEVRRRILSGRWVRKVVHGQPYWAEVA